MHDRLKHIYEGVLAGTISKADALLRIRSLQSAGSQTWPPCLLEPFWQQADRPAAGDVVASGRHVVAVCGATPATAKALSASMPQMRLELWPALPDDGGLAFADLAARCFALVRSCLEGAGTLPVLLQVVVEDALGAGLVPLLQSAALENRHFSGQVILAHVAEDDALPRLLRSEAGSAEPLIRHRNGDREIQRWREVSPGVIDGRAAFRDNGVYLITGGLGRLGRLVAADMLRLTTQARVVLTGRSPSSAKTTRSLADYAGGRVEYRQMALDEAASVSDVVAGVHATYGRLDGVLHAAGTTADNFILRKTPAEFAAVLTPKVAGTVYLDHATRDMDLDFFVLFSSLAAAVGNIGQADYATANGFLDVFAAHRRDRVACTGQGGRSLSIDWSLWREGGLQIDAASLDEIVDRTKVAPIDGTDGLRALQQLLLMDGCRYLAGTGEATQATRRLNGEAPIAALPPLRSVGLPAEDRAAAAERLLVRILASSLKLAPGRIDPAAMMDQYGIDSILAMTLTGELEKSFGRLPKTLFFEYRTIRDLAGYFVQAHPDATASLVGATERTKPLAAPTPLPRPMRNGRHATPPASARPQVAGAAGHEPIAIVGVSGRYPQSPDLESFWQNLREGRDCITEVPAERWDWRDYYSEDRTAEGRHYSKWGGFIPGIDEFDSLFFNISPREAHDIDPQERLFLQHAYMAVEDAGYARATLSRLRDDPARGEVGVYVGVMYNEYQMFGVEESLRGRRRAMNGSVAAIANRVSFFLDLHGPSMTLDTMCSSSLTAIHLACQDLHLGRTGMAIAGGVNVTVHPNKYLLLSAGQFISSTGQCQSFGEGGAGYVPGEGVGAVVLKRLADALADGDQIHALIRGSALSHGGRTNGFSVPSPRGQANAIRRALDDAGIEASRIGYVEAHGTGTKLGDPIEIATLTSVFKDQDLPPGTCPIGSVKSNIGHCESAAGMAALTKVLLQMRHGEIVPSLHSARLNPYIDFAGGPFIVNQTVRPWARQARGGRELPRVAGISSFGAGGSNAHLVIEEYLAPPGPAPASGQDVAILLSARTEAQLRQKARDLLGHVQALGEDADLPAIACTLQLGRDAMAERLAVLATSGRDLTARLQSWLDGDDGGVARGQAGGAREGLSMFGSDGDLRSVLARWLTDGKLGKLVELWVKGVDLDWSKLYAGARPRNVGLPAYPFARDRYWVQTQPGGAVEASASRLHALVQRNVSTLTQHGYTSRFDGEELFFADQDGGRVLSGLAQVAMAGIAVRLAQPESAGGVVELRALCWGEAYDAAPAGELGLAVTPAADMLEVELFSIRGTEERVHFQAQAVLATQDAEQRVDLDTLRARMRPAIGVALGVLRVVFRGDDEMLAELSAFESGPHDPELLDVAVMLAALQGAALLAGEAAPALMSLQSARLAAACDAASVVWIRRSGGQAGPRFDIDILGRQGDVQIQVRSLQLGVSAGHEPVPQPLPVAAPQRREIPFAAAPASAALRRFISDKPTGVTLVLPAAAARDVADIRGKPRVGLPALTAEIAPSGGVKLYDEGDGTVTIRIGGCAADRLACDVTAREVLAALRAAAHLPGARALVLQGGAGGLLPEIGVESTLFRSLTQAVVEAPFPVIAALEGDAVDGGFVLAALCDMLVCSESARYGLTDKTQRQAGLTALLAERFGPVLGDRLLCRLAADGDDLRRFGLTALVVPAADVAQRAAGQAAILAGHGREALLLLKAHLARHLATGLAAWQPTPVPVAARASSAPVALPDTMTGLTLRRADDGVVVARLTMAGGQTSAGLAELVACLQGRRDIAALVVEAAEADFLADLDESNAFAVLSSLRRLTLDSAVPVVWALSAGARDLGWVAALLADRCVYDADARYGIALDRMAPSGARVALDAFSCRFGDRLGWELALAGGPYAAGDLLRGRADMIVAERGTVLTEAVAQAAMLARLGGSAARHWKAGRIATLRIAPHSDAGWPVQTVSTPSVSRPGPIALRSLVVGADLDTDGVVLVRMQDRAARNMFSPELVEGVEEAFAAIAALPAAKVVVLTGYDGHFSSGGTRDGLLAIQQGRARFTDVEIFSAPLRCRLPVIAAMQGDGIGAGWSLGMFADITFLAAEGRYLSPYMAYGFTPGAGATLIFPSRIGYDLARETLLTARPSTGEELRLRGMVDSVLPQRDVVAAVLALARRLARLPLPVLLGAKAFSTAKLRDALPDALQRELAMHERTFVGQADTLQRIEDRFAMSSDAVSVALTHQQAPAPPPLSAVSFASVLGVLRGLLAAELQVSGSEIGDATQFVDLGLDSISGVTFVRKINARFAISIEATLIYSQPTLALLAGHVAAEIARLGLSAPPSLPPAAPAGSLPQVAAQTAGLELPTRLRARRGSRGKSPGRSHGGMGTPTAAEPVAVIGMVGQFPKAATLEAFWRNIAEGRDCIDEVPRARWDVDAYYQPGPPAPGKTNSRWMGALEDYDRFDPLFFNISPAEAESMDPQQRLFLQACWNVIEHAGYDAGSLAGSACGVFVGCAASDYHLASASSRLSAQGFTGGASSILAARISYFLDLQGPSLAIDTACSSSLVAIAQACDSLQSGASSIALAGGVYVMSGPEMHIKTAQAGMLSTDGRCFTFDQRANGFVPGEAVAVVMLKRLSDAERDGDSIYGVIRGWGVNQDGKTNGITAPSPRAQARLQREVYARFGIDPGQIGLIEAHGTGTKLGDPIEVAALRAAFGESGHAGSCALGSVKSNIGHCLTAAGIAGFLKLVLALHRRQLPPSIHFEQLNEHIALSGSPFYVNDRLRPWPAEGPRLAAINAFGFSGTNAHVVVGDHARPPSPEPLDPHDDGRTIVPLSAKTREQLQQRAADLLDMLKQANPPADIADIAYTLQVGRQHMEERAAFIANSIQELIEKLQRFLETGAGLVQAASAVSVAEKLAAQWQGGAAVDWLSLYAEEDRPRRIGLPVYPFARECYGLEADQNLPAAVTQPVVTILSPPASDLLLLAQEWQATPAEASGDQPWDVRIVVLCGETVAGLAQHLPGARLEYWPALDTTEDYAERAMRCFALVRDCLTGTGDRPVLLQIVVSERQNILSGLTGLLRTAGLETPRFAGQIVQVKDGMQAAALAGVLNAEATGTPEPLVRHGDGRRSVPRWVPLRMQDKAAPIGVRNDGVYLITGGLGALGLLFAEDILRQGSRARVILTGRSPLGAEGLAKMAALDPRRTAYRVMALDAGAAVSATVDAVLADHGRLDGVLHAAGMTADTYITRKTATAFAAVLAPKVSGTVHLDRATAALNLDFFALFSSVASAFGNVGQADYAAANGFLDAYADLRTARVAASGRGGRTVSIGWSLWRDGGMQIEAETQAGLASTLGIVPIDTAEGLSAFQRCLYASRNRILVAQGDADRLLAALASVKSAPPVAATPPIDATQLAARTLVCMKALFGSVLKLAPGRIDETKQFSAYGIDSLLVSGLNVAFAKVFGEISKTVVFEHTNLASLTGYFVARYPAACAAWTGAPTQAAKPATRPTVVAAPRAPAKDQPIAIIGLSGIYPRAAGLAQFWANLQNGEDSISEIPQQRWPVEGFYEPDIMRSVELGRSYCKWGGFVDEFAQFDPLFFGMSPREAMSIDPQERMFLQTAWHALEDAGYTRADLHQKFHRRVGVFAGITKQGFNLHGSEASRRDRKFYPHTSFSSLANRLSYFLDITGPSLPIDTMCSSSLTAIHEACEHIRHGACDMAFAGGVNLYLHSSTYVDMAAQYALSRDGRCRSFGDGANGFVPGEGVGAILLRPLDAAIADGDHIHAVILATHINHGGKTNGYTVPNPRAQAELIAETIAKAGLDARRISYVEAHGTGTELGDPIEIEGLKQAFARSTARTGFCHIGSAKSNIGHLEAAAGMAGLAKIVLQMKHGQIAPSLHTKTLNPAIDFVDSPFVVCRELTPWEPVDDEGAPMARVAGLSSFGAGGANAHLLVQEHVALDRPPAPDPSPAIVPFSAKTAAQLQDVAASMLRFLERREADLRLDDLAYSLQVGREPMEVRAAFVVASLDDLVDALGNFLSGKQDAGHYGQAKPDLAQDEGMRLAVATWIQGGRLDRLAQFWVTGLQVNWASMYGATQPSRISLPGYPFSRETYWAGPDQKQAARGVLPERRHSLAIENIVAMVDDDRMDIGRAVDMLNALA